MKKFIRISTCVLILAMMFSMTSCAQKTEATSVTTTEAVSDTAALYYVGAESRKIMDDGTMELSINCNYFADADNSDMDVTVIDPAGEVVYEYHETFISGKTYTAVLNPEDCGIVKFAGGDYVISVSNSFNNYVGEAVVHTELYPENAIVQAQEDTTGKTEGTSYVNEYFGMRLDCPKSFYIDDLSWYLSDYTNGYTTDFVAFSEDDSLYVTVLVGKMYYEKDVTTEELIDYMPYEWDVESSEVVTLDGIEFLKFTAWSTDFYMTNKDSDIIIIELSYYNDNATQADEIASAISAIS